MENVARNADVILVQETHATLEEFVVACPRIAALFHCEAAPGSAATGGLLTLVNENPPLKSRSLNES